MRSNVSARILLLFLVSVKIITCNSSARGATEKEDTRYTGASNMINDMKQVFFGYLTGLSESGFSVGVGFTKGQPAWVHSTYNQGWVDHYIDNRFVLADPTIVHGQKENGHFTWSELEGLYPENPVFKAATRFGLTEGNTLSLSIGGSRTILSCSGPKWDETQLKCAKAATSGLHSLFAPVATAPAASKKELEVMRLMSGGLRDLDISEELGIKLETVRMRRRRFYEKTGTVNPASAISFAIRNSWI